MISLKTEQSKISPCNIDEKMTDKFAAKYNLPFDEPIKGKNVIIPNLTHLLVGSNIISLIDTLLKIKKLWINLKIIKTIPILAITVNPFYPSYRYENSRYEKGWVNKKELYNKVKSVVSIPVIDIVKKRRKWPI
jgi:hypothetical protein